MNAVKKKTWGYGRRRKLTKKGNKENDEINDDVNFNDYDNGFDRDGFREQHLNPSDSDTPIFLFYENGFDYVFRLSLRFHLNDWNDKHNSIDFYWDKNLYSVFSNVGRRNKILATPKQWRLFFLFFFWKSWCFVNVSKRKQENITYKEKTEMGNRGRVKCSWKGYTAT